MVTNSSDQQSLELLRSRGMQINEQEAARTGEGKKILRWILGQPWEYVNGTENWDMGSL